MTHASGTRRSYDRVAQRYAREVGDELRHKPLDRALLDALAELAGGGPIVDVGAGPGHVARYLAGRGGRPVALDLSAAMCGIARRGGTPAIAADMTALPVRPATVAAITCMFAVIHLDAGRRPAAYREFARVLRPGGHALIAFHTGDADTATGSERRMTEWWDTEIDLTFRFLDPAAETRALADAGLELVARLDRAPHPQVEHQSERSYLLACRPVDSAEWSVTR